MSTSWKDFVDAFRIGSETGNIEKLSNIIAEDFDWVTSDMDRQALHYRGLQQLLWNKW